MLKIYQEPITQKIEDPLLNEKGVSLFIKREDLIHPYVSGNKWRKLRYNLIEAKERGYSRLLTFGGAFSNHIYATAAAAKEAGFECIGLIRGEELATKPLNKTLSFAKEKGMQLHFVEREVYREKDDPDYLFELIREFGEFYLLPEGGTNKLAVNGCAQILDINTKYYDIICCSVGTGGTLMGLISSAEKQQRVIGFSSLKGNFLENEIQLKMKAFGIKTKVSWQIEDHYHFGGYAKTSKELIDFIINFERKTNILLDQVYTGKMMFGIYDLIRKGNFKQGTKILAIHTGGLQGRSSLLSPH
ncbi:MAG: pyridoxal-phosphate dependent enzyme [Fulvivirga sp.]|uniref:1-aminocyclopropane-1-carboxylate deaminase/D-cysteine desulfhydrase n=1 Tax=Fulvivirga sp. TaxID=1931237 RepID=UPI0032EE2323